MAGGRFRDQEVDDDLALRRQQRAEPAQSGRKLRHIRRDKAVEKVTRILAGYLDHAPIGKKRCLHVAKFLFKFLLKAGWLMLKWNVSRYGPPHKARAGR